MSSRVYVRLTKFFVHQVLAAPILFGRLMQRGGPVPFMFDSLRQRIQPAPDQASPF
jgi:hypothetical protein